MKSPLWIRKYSPDIDDLNDGRMKGNLKIATRSDMNILVGGPKGVGKSSIVRCICNRNHSNPEKSVTYINVSDIFDMTKKDISKDDRFSRMVNTKNSKRDMIQNSIQEISGYATATGGYKTIVLDNFEGCREDFQNSLRRTMELYYSTTQFIIITRSPSTIIEPLKSRCHPIQIEPPSVKDITRMVGNINEKQDFEYSEKGISYLWSKTRPNIRRFILLLQLISQRKGNVNANSVEEITSEMSDREEIQEIISSARNGNFKSVKKKVRELTDKKGYKKTSLAQKILDVSCHSMKESEFIVLCKTAGEVDVSISQSSNPSTQIIELLSEWKRRSQPQ